MGLTPNGAIVTFFHLDLTERGAGHLYITPGTNELHQPITWQGQVYNPFPVEASGFDFSGAESSPARPTFRVSNVTQLVGSLVRQYQDLIGCKVTRKRTFARYLDAINFELGNPEANPAIEFPQDIFYIERKVVENKLMVEFELSSPMDLSGVTVPRRSVLCSVCPSVYKGAECGYAGALPSCDKGLDTPNGCAVHFGTTAELPFGGFPGAGRHLS